MTHHKELADGKWRGLTLAEQFGNIGSEVYRALRWRGKDDEQFKHAIERALELYDLTLEDPRWLGARKREIARAREIFCDAITGGKEYGSSLESVDQYLSHFAYAARKDLE
ncbi:MAG: hypothetical protein HYT12_03535 [Candidatus Liptonbacteria bacterium]|nr:hypothetical protein [Candidatus Liptonbacteria bacterium]